jgi:hypothetical protein
MSLFHSDADRALPLLTQFYQLNPEDKAELSTFTQREKERLGNVIEKDPPWTLEEENVEEVGYWSGMISLHRHTRNILDELANTQRVYKPDWESIQLGLRFFNAAERVLHMRATPDAQGFLTAEVAKEADYELVWPFLLMERVCQALRDVLQKPERVRRCEECRSVYVARRNYGNHFCSERCSTRFHTRERRQRQRQKQQEGDRSADESRLAPGRSIVGTGSAKS